MKHAAKLFIFLFCITYILGVIASADIDLFNWPKDLRDMLSGFLACVWLLAIVADAILNDVNKAANK